MSLQHLLIHEKIFMAIFDEYKSIILKTIIKTGIIGFGVGGNTFHAPIIYTTKGFEISKIRARKESEIQLAR